MTIGAKLSAWLDERTGHKKLLAAVLDEPIPGGARWAYVFGATLALLFVVEAVTGALLATAYAPSVQTAWASVHYITFAMSGGWIVRGLHHYGCDAMIVVLGMHLFQVAAYGAYKRPREVTWWVGILLLAMVLGFAVTGSLLPWDQSGYWARRVETNIAGTVPLVGAWVQGLVMGGSDYGSLTLARFYALHVAVLPASLAGLLALHVALYRKHGNTPPASLTREAARKTEPFFPSQVAKNLLATLLVVAVVFYLTVKHHGAPLDAPADPVSDYPARPEWYLLWMFRLLHVFEGSAGSVAALLVPAVVAGYLVLLPLLDKAPGTAIRPRAIVLGPLVLGAMGILGLTFGSMQSDAADAGYQASRKKADARAEIAVSLARRGVPPGGPLQMLRSDPGLHGEELFTKSCASCHTLGDLGDAKKATAPSLDGCGTTAWLLAMVHDPDGDARFGRTPYKGQMPSADVAPKDRKPDDPPFKPMSKEDMLAVASFLAAQGDAPGDPPGAGRGDEAARKAGEKIVTDRCTGCHLYKGDGDDGDQGLAPELSGYGSLAWVRAQIANPATKATYRPKAVDDGKSKGHMPRFDGDLSPADLDLVARWTRARARGVPLGE